MYHVIVCLCRTFKYKHLPRYFFYNNKEQNRNSKRYKRKPLLYLNL